MLFWLGILVKEVSASSNNTIAQILHSGQQQSPHPRPPEGKMKALLVQQKEEQAAQNKQLADTIEEN